MHALFILPIATYVVLAGYLIWDSPKRNLEAGGPADGAGGHQDSVRAPKKFLDNRHMKSVKSYQRFFYYVR